MKTLRTFLKSLAVIATGAAFSASAYANMHHFTKYVTHSVTVNYSDLNLNHMAGVDTLYKRLRLAGNRVCGPVYGMDELNPAQDWQNFRTCYKNALDGAAAKVGNQQLSQMIYGKLGAPTTVAER